MAEQKVAREFSLAELRGLRRWSEEQGRFVVEAWEASGETMNTFAVRLGIWPQRVQWWRERLRHAEAAGSGPASALTSTFVPMTVRDEDTAPLEPPGAVSTTVVPAPAVAIRVVVSHDVRVEIAELNPTSAAWVAALVRSLREVSP
jgi:hypothetical protein